MTDNIVTLKPRKTQKEEEQRESMLEILAFMKQQVEEGNLTEFVATSLNKDGDAQIHVCTLDLPGSIGLYEIGKHILISQHE